MVNYVIGNENQLVCLIQGLCQGVDLNDRTELGGVG